MPNFLLHSLASFEPLITDVLDATGARSVAEIGGEGGTFTVQLVRWADRVGGEVQCVDPTPSMELTRLADSEDRLGLVRESSPRALELLPRMDAYILDGDHNYWTVSAELEALDGLLHDADRPVPLFLHDVAWPSARRDSYYAPERLPADAVHPHTYRGGVSPESSGVQAFGFSSAGQFAFALREGGPRNGVLTAVEDFLADRPELEFHIVPAVFGLGVLFLSGATWAGRVRALIRPHQQPLVERLERNRIELYVTVIQLQAELERRGRVHQLQLRNASSQGEGRSAAPQAEDAQQKA